MLRRWYEEGIEDDEVFRRRFRWALAIQWSVQLGATALVLLTR
jgi:hypothetical protein